MKADSNERKEFRIGDLKDFDASRGLRTRKKIGVQRGLGVVLRFPKRAIVGGGEVRVEVEFEIPMVKLLRAHGGCLGIERRRKAWKSAKSLGEPTNR